MTDTPQENSAPAGKGKATPKRKESQALRQQPLVANTRGPRTAADKQRASEARLRAREGYAAGDERFMPERDRGPQKRFVRDWVDARSGFGEWILPMMLLILITTFIQSATVQVIGLIVVWGYLAILTFDSVLLANKVTKKVAEKFGADNVQSGLKMYAVMRSIQMRFTRLPKPQVKRGEFPS